MSYYIKVKDLKTQYSKASGIPSFTISSGQVEPGHCDYPVKTDFANLTQEQREVLSEENLHYKLLALSMGHIINDGYVNYRRRP